MRKILIDEKSISAPIVSMLELEALWKTAHKNTCSIRNGMCCAIVMSMELFRKYDYIIFKQSMRKYGYVLLYILKIW